jgi:hypothetical protein
MKGKSKQSHNINNEVENVMLKGHPLPQINSDGGALANMRGKNEEL